MPHWNVNMLIFLKTEMHLKIIWFTISTQFFSQENVFWFPVFPVTHFPVLEDSGAFSEHFSSINLYLFIVVQYRPQVKCPTSRNNGPLFLRYPQGWVRISQTGRICQSRVHYWCNTAFLSLSLCISPIMNATFGRFPCLLIWWQFCPAGNAKQECSLHSILQYNERNVEPLDVCPSVLAVYIDSVDPFTAVIIDCHRVNSWSCVTHGVDVCAIMSWHWNKNVRCLPRE